MNNILTLAIDTSFDETSVSIVNNTTILANILPSQMEYHQKYGGVVPSLAKLAHQERIDNVVNETLKKAGKKIEDIDLIASTVGPGLAIALEVGVKKAKELATKYNKPLVMVNHMEGHLLSAFAERNSKSEVLNSKKTTNNKLQTSNVKFPALGFLISGGHTELILVKDFGDYEKIGETLDDSCGEAYDKCGRILGLGYPAGPVISEFARRHRKTMDVELIKNNQSTIIKTTNKKTKAIYQLPIAMVHSGDLNFSYSGLKTAFKQLVESLTNKKLSHNDEIGGTTNLTKEQIYDLSVTFEAAALTQLSIKLEKALKMYENTGSRITEVWLGGGVVASTRLKSVMRQICRKYKITIRFPYAKNITRDNAAMIAVVANIKVMKYGIKHNPKMGIYLRDFDAIDRDPTLSL